MCRIDHRSRTMSPRGLAEFWRSDPFLSISGQSGGNGMPTPPDISLQRPAVRADQRPPLLANTPSPCSLVLRPLRFRRVATSLGTSRPVVSLLGVPV